MGMLWSSMIDRESLGRECAHVSRFFSKSFETRSTMRALAKLFASLTISIQQTHVGRSRPSFVVGATLPYPISVGQRRKSAVRQMDGSDSQRLPPARSRMTCSTTEEIRCRFHLFGSLQPQHFLLCLALSFLFPPSFYPLGCTHEEKIWSSPTTRDPQNPSTK